MRRDEEHSGRDAELAKWWLHPTEVPDGFTLSEAIDYARSKGYIGVGPWRSRTTYPILKPLKKA